jgi:threonine dehydrogenase-like Zn-dependent dehydrogenase
MMCSSATSLHALNKARFKSGESVAVFGAGGLGLSAIQLARAMGAQQILAVDIQPGKLELARSFGAVPINATAGDPVEQIRSLTGGRGVDVALELIGLPLTMRQAIQCLAIKGRAALAGITEKTFEVAPYQEVLNKEAEIIGVSDHLARELPLLIQWAREGKLNAKPIIAGTVPLDAQAINETLNRLETFGSGGRVVVTP